MVHEMAAISKLFDVLTKFLYFLKIKLRNTYLGLKGACSAMYLIEEKTPSDVFFPKIVFSFRSKLYFLMELVVVENLDYGNFVQWNIIYRNIGSPTLEIKGFLPRVLGLKFYDSGKSSSYLKL